MGYADYEALALRTEKPLNTHLDRLEHAALGLITEGGEFTTEIKRMAIYDKPLDDARRAHIGEEIGDAAWYVAIASDSLGMQVFHALEHDWVLLPGSFASLALQHAQAIGRFAELVLSAQSTGLDEQHQAGMRDAVWTAGNVLVNIASRAGLLVTDLLDANVAKLRERFPDAYSNEAAEARADKGGLDARNS